MEASTRFLLAARLSTAVCGAHIFYTAHSKNCNLVIVSQRWAECSREPVPGQIRWSPNPLLRLDTFHCFAICMRNFFILMSSSINAIRGFIYLFLFFNNLDFVTLGNLSTSSNVVGLQIMPAANTVANNWLSGGNVLMVYGGLMLAGPSSVTYASLMFDGYNWRPYQSAAQTFGSGTMAFVDGSPPTGTRRLNVGPVESVCLFFF